MADDKTLEEDDELTIVEVAKVPTAEELAAADRDAAEAGDKDDEHEDEGDDEDTRLAEREDDGDDKTKEKRRKRREAQKAARDRTLAAVDLLTRQNAELTARLTAVEGHTVGMTEREIASKLAQAKARLADFDAIIGKAIEEGNGAEATTAMRLRDETRDEARGLETAASQIEKAKTTPPERKVDPRVATYASQWRMANDWYDPKGGDEDSAIVNAIDNRMTADGFDPATPAYWQELTKRVAKRLGTADDSRERGGREERGREERGSGARKGPAIGGDRSAGSPGSRKEVYVTPERKQAMIDAGIWDDPQRRAKMLKTYRDYDASSPAR